MTARLALAGLVLAAPLLGAASCAPDPVKLAPIPAPPPVIVHVPTYISLPLDATTPCPRPQARPIRTDLDLLKAADAFKVWGMCSQNKLDAIKAAQP
jgi:hypothetical protein